MTHAPFPLDYNAIPVPDWPDYDEEIWPTEQEINDWNIHNDHADGYNSDDAC